jgi:hypothetical protein
MGKEDADMTKPIHEIQHAHPTDVARDLARAVAILKAGGCREIYLFGSTATGDRHVSGTWLSSTCLLSITRTAAF